MSFIKQAMLPMVKGEHTVIWMWQATACREVLQESGLLTLTQCYLKELVINFNTFRGQRGYKESGEGRQKEGCAQSIPLNYSTSTDTFMEEIQKIYVWSRERQSGFENESRNTGPNIIHHISGMGGKKLHDRVFTEVYFIRWVDYASEMWEHVFSSVCQGDGTVGWGIWCVPQKKMCVLKIKII